MLKVIFSLCSDFHQLNCSTDVKIMVQISQNIKDSIHFSVFLPRMTLNFLQLLNPLLDQIWSAKRKKRDNKITNISIGAYAVNLYILALSPLNLLRLKISTSCLVFIPIAMSAIIFPVTGPSLNPVPEKPTAMMMFSASGRKSMTGFSSGSMVYMQDSSTDTTGSTPGKCLQIKSARRFFTDSVSALSLLSGSQAGPSWRQIWGRREGNIDCCQVSFSPLPGLDTQMVAAPTHLLLRQCTCHCIWRCGGETPA